MSDRSSRLYGSKHIIRDEMSLQEGGKFILLKIMRAHEFKKKKRIICMNKSFIKMVCLFYAILIS